MSTPSHAVGTVFLHAVDDAFQVVVERGDERLFRGRLELKDTDAGPRPGRFRIRRGDDIDRRRPQEFVTLARGADRIRISEQTPRAGRREVRALFEAYQLGGAVETVRTCRRCATAGRYAPLTDDTAIEAGDEEVCRDCAIRELEREASYRGLQSGARRRLAELVVEIGNLDRVMNLMSGELDPALTKFDELRATGEAVEPLRVEALNLKEETKSLYTDRFDELLPVQSLAVRNGALAGRDLLVVSATATGKTLIGELAGIDRLHEGAGTFLFLVPLVALANQKYHEFEDRYGEVADVSLRVGGSRIRGGGTQFDPTADIIVGTYEGVDHALRSGRDLGDIGTVAVDEVHMLGDSDRGHRLDGLVTRLKYRTRTADTQWLYLSATVGNPVGLADALDAELVAFEDRPVPIERHVTFVNEAEKPAIADRLVTRAYEQESSKGYRGQTIIFTNSRRHCHELSGRLATASAPYHAGLDYGRRKQIERQFANQELAAVVTTAALAAGVDFPASQVVFDSLAMGIEWLTVQEFEQMLGRAGRPDYHDMGTVYLLVEPEGTYHGSQERTEDEVAFQLLRGDMEPVLTAYNEEIAVEETLANLVVAGREAKRLNDRMVGDVDTERAIARLIDNGFVDGHSPTTLGEAVTEQFLAPEEAMAVLESVRHGGDPDDLVAELELRAG